MDVSLVLSVVALVLALVSFLYGFKVALVYHRFNEQIKSWAESLDDNISRAIGIASRRILLDLDARISEEKENNNEEIEEENE